VPRDIDRGGQSFGQRCLADAGHILNEQMPLGQQAHDGQADSVVLALNDLGNVGHDRLETVGEGIDTASRRSLSWHAVGPFPAEYCR